MLLSPDQTFLLLAIIVLCRIRLAFKASEMFCFDVSIPMVATNQTRAMARIFRGGVLLVDVVNSNYTFIIKILY